MPFSFSPAGTERRTYKIGTQCRHERKKPPQFQNNNRAIRKSFLPSASAVRWLGFSCARAANGAIAPAKLILFAASPSFHSRLKICAAHRNPPCASAVCNKKRVHRSENLLVRLLLLLVYPHALSAWELELPAARRRPRSASHAFSTKRTAAAVSCIAADNNIKISIAYMWMLSLSSGGHEAFCVYIEKCHEELWRKLQTDVCCVLFCRDFSRSPLLRWFLFMILSWNGIYGHTSFSCWSCKVFLQYSIPYG